MKEKQREGMMKEAERNEESERDGREKQWHVWHTVNKRSQASKMIRTESSNDDSERKRASEKERSTKRIKRSIKASRTSVSSSP